MELLTGKRGNGLNRWTHFENMIFKALSKIVDRAARMNAGFHI